MSGRTYYICRWRYAFILTPKCSSPMTAGYVPELSKDDGSRGPCMELPRGDLVRESKPLVVSLTPEELGMAQPIHFGRMPVTGPAGLRTLRPTRLTLSLTPNGGIRG